MSPNNKDSRSEAAGQLTEAGPGHQHVRWLLLPWLVRSCCQCQPGFRSHWRDREMRGEEEEQVPSQVSGHPSKLPSRCFSEQALASSTSPIAAASYPQPSLYL